MVGQYWENIDQRSGQYGTRAEIIPGRSQASLVSDRFIGKNSTIMDWKDFKGAILIGSQPGLFSRLMLNKTEVKESWKKKEKESI